MTREGKHTPLHPHYIPMVFPRMRFFHQDIWSLPSSRRGASPLSGWQCWQEQQKHLASCTLKWRSLATKMTAKHTWQLSFGVKIKVPGWNNDHHDYMLSHYLQNDSRIYSRCFCSTEKSWFLLSFSSQAAGREGLLNLSSSQFLCSTTAASPVLRRGDTTCFRSRRRGENLPEVDSSSAAIPIQSCCGGTSRCCVLGQVKFEVFLNYSILWYIIITL